MNPQRRAGGYALMTLLLLAALTLILVSAEVPRLLTQGQREREEELIFRGGQYRRAIGLYFRKYGRLPLKLEELYEPANDLRFLRRPFPDPMSQDGKWRVIRVGPLGELIGSRTRERMQLQAPGGSPAGQQQEEKKKKEEQQGVTREQDTGGVNLPLIGVASRSTRPSIKRYENETSYDRWEFIYDPVADAASRVAPGTSGPRPNPPQRPQ